MEKQPIIEFTDYSFKYFTQAKPTLKNINLNIYKGEKVLIIGPSGSGKSTLGHTLNGLIPFSYKGEITGSLKIKSAEAKEQNIFELSKTIGTVLQDSDGQFVGLTVGEDIAFSLENDNVVQHEMKQRVLEASKMVDMENWLTSSPFELSGGQKQRVALAGVLIDNVEILLFDEPLANLDPATGKTAIEIIDEIHNSGEKTIIIIEHRLEDVLHRGVDRIIVVNNGEIVADLPPHSLMCSEVLSENGIREPLYITALKLAGVKLKPEMLPGFLSTLKAEDIKKPLQSWFAKEVKDSVNENTEPLLSLENLSFSYDSKNHVLKNINFNVYKGEMLSVIGKNGAGKSTLTKLLCGFFPLSGGSIKYQGNDIKEKTIRERAEIIGLVMQNPNQMISKPMIYDEVALGLRLRNVSEKETEKRVMEALKICGLEKFKSWPISALSYGQKKRVTIASILVLKPEILILDEPTAGQDYRHYSEMMNFLLKLNKSGITVILITHDMHLMLEYTPRAVVLSEGRLIADTASSIVLTNSEIINEANLKQTSLYQLANKAGIQDGTGFVQHFIDFERAERNEAFFI